MRFLHLTHLYAHLKRALDVADSLIAGSDWKVCNDYIPDVLRHNELSALGEVSHGYYVSWSVTYKDPKGEIKTTPRRNNGCWGFLGDDNLEEACGIPRERLLTLNYHKVSGNLKFYQSLPKNVVDTYLEVMRRSGIGQWCEKYPKNHEEFIANNINEPLVSISVDHPAQMVIGLMEMFRDLFYHRKYCYVVCRLHRDMGLSAGASLILPRIINFSGDVPGADAMEISKFTMYYPGVFSRKHIDSCMNNYKTARHKSPVPLREDSEFHGVFNFFRSGYKSSVHSPLKLGLPKGDIFGYFTDNYSKTNEGKSWTREELRAMGRLITKKFSEIH